ncbi:MAG TPA: hypothetical protein VGL03_16330, partial [Thermoanaerobaculia bacterium]
MLIRRAFLAAIFLAVLDATRLPAETPDKWTPLETLKYRPVSDVQISPDGKKVVYVVRDSVMESDKSEYRTQLWLSSSDGKDSLQLTRQPHGPREPRLIRDLG